MRQERASHQNTNNTIIQNFSIEKKFGDCSPFYFPPHPHFPRYFLTTSTLHAPCSVPTPPHVLLLVADSGISRGSYHHRELFFRPDVSDGRLQYTRSAFSLRLHVYQSRPTRGLGGYVWCGGMHRRSNCHNWEQLERLAIMRKITRALGGLSG
jgi:hypothetical protein